MHKNARQPDPSEELAAESGAVPGAWWETPLAGPGATLAAPVESALQDPLAGSPSATDPLQNPLPTTFGPVLAGPAALSANRPVPAPTALATRSGGASGTALGAEASAQRADLARPAARGPERAAPDAGLRQQEQIQRAETILNQLRVHLTRGGVSQATLTLVPAELGRLSIRVAVHQGRVAAVVRAESPETLELLERHVPELRAALVQSGLEPETFEFELGFGAEDGPAGDNPRGHRDATPLSALNSEAIGPAASGRRGAQLRSLVERLTTDDPGVDTYA